MYYHPDKNQILTKDQYLRVTNAYKAIGKTDLRDDYDEQQLDNLGKLKLGSSVYSLSHFGAFIVITNVIFWSWYCWDDILGKGGDCPIDNVDIGKMKNEGVDWKERRIMMDKLSSKRESEKN